MKRTVLLLALLALPFAAWPENRDQLVKQYSDFAGSDANSQSLVDGLRSGKEVKLSDGKTTTTFTPPTGNMGNGNVKIALALAEADLKKQGVANPTPEQIKAEVSKILQERADHKGWGRIAQERGFKVGDLMRSGPSRQSRSAGARRRIRRPGHPGETGRPEHPDRSGGAHADARSCDAASAAARIGSVRRRGGIERRRRDRLAGATMEPGRRRRSFRSVHGAYGSDP
jgi:hypothetical protein